VPKIRNEVLLAAVAKIVCNRSHVWPPGLAQLRCCGQEPAPLEQPFRPDADVILEELLQPTLALTKGSRDGLDRNKLLVLLNCSNDLVHQLNVPVGRGMQLPQHAEQAIDRAWVVEGQKFVDVASVGGRKHLLQSCEPVLQIHDGSLPERMKAAWTETDTNDPAAAGRDISSPASKCALNSGLPGRDEGIDVWPVHHFVVVERLVDVLPANRPRAFDEGRQLDRPKVGAEVDVTPEPGRVQATASLVPICGSCNTRSTMVPIVVAQDIDRRSQTWRNRYVASAP
jgi:hypothetical protein